MEVEVIKMNNKILIGVALVLVLGIGAFLLLSNQANNTGTVEVATTPTPTATTSSPTTSASPSAVMEKGRNVTVNANGFAPQTLSIKAGTKVTWTNKSGETATVNSAPHPTHTLFPFLNLASFDDGASVEVVFDKAGTYTYHNHLNPSQTGTVIVE